jgi:hypothetical protein
MLADDRSQSENSRDLDSEMESEAPSFADDTYFSPARKAKTRIVLEMLIRNQ